MPPVPAAQYLRMSTEHQNYSLEHQAAAIALYAAERGFEIVETYADPGRSGVRLAGRDALKRLLADVVSPRPPFAVVLVYDVSRWGRFQDPDESAHYEFICRSAGVRVEYCAELFENDNSTASAIIKHLKRVMAAEYSRDLSVKIAAAQHRLAGYGFWQGGPPGYGLRRQVVDEAGRPGQVMAPGEAKAVHKHRVRLVAGARDRQARPGRRRPVAARRAGRRHPGRAPGGGHSAAAGHLDPPRRRGGEARDRAAPGYSTLIPRASITPFQRAISAATKRRMSSGVLVTASPSSISASRAFTEGCATACATARFSAATTSPGVPRGAATPPQVVAS